MKFPPPKKVSGPPPKRKPVEKILEAKHQGSLFHMDPDWTEHWKGMPEFVCDDLKPWKSITVNFSKFEDLQDFSKLIAQTVTLNTRSVWYPEADIDHTVHLQYVDVSASAKKHYFEWKRAGRVLTREVPLTLPPEAEARVLAYESCMELLNT